MELNLSLNNEKNNAANTASGWFVETAKITSPEDAKKYFCNHSFSPHHWKDGIRNQQNYIQTECITTDFDNGLSVAEAQKRYSNFNFILITSKSHQIIKPKHEDLGKVDRFHIIFPIDKPITDPDKIKRLKYARIFEGSDTSVYETGRFFFPSPQTAEVYMNENGKNLDIDTLEYVDAKQVTNVKTKTFDLSTINKIRKHCIAAEETFSAIEKDQAHRSKGHKQRLLAANIIHNTTNNEDYVKKLFSNLNDYDEAKTLKYYRSFDSLPITCRKLQEFDWGLCSKTCPLMQDIGKKSPIALKYRSAAGLQTNEELFKNLDVEDNLNELLSRIKNTSNPLRRQKLIERTAAETGLKTSAINQAIKDLSVVDDERPFIINGKVNEVKAAEYIIDKYKIIRYREDFYSYENGIWLELPKEEMEAIIHKEIKMWSDNHTISETLNAVKRECYVSEKLVEEKTDPYTIACNNGLLDINNNSFRDFKQTDFRFQKMKANYDPNGIPADFLTVLDEVFDGDADKDDKIKMLQEIMGYILIADYSIIKKMFYFWGPKANNGKSTILDILQAVMGQEYIDSIPLNKLDGFMLKRLAGKHANIVGDQDAAVKVPDGVIKQLVGGRDWITADVKNKEAINFKNYARLIFAVNKLPFSQAKDAGYYTRVAVLVFNNEFVPSPTGKQKKADPEKIDRIIENELSGILNWMLEGLQRLLKTKQLTIPPSSVEALSEYKTENNSVLQFVKENCQLDVSEKINRSELYRNYCDWCDENGFKHKTNATTFYKTIETDFDVQQMKSDGIRYLIGIGQFRGMF